MKKSDFIFLLVATAIFLPFFVSDDAYEWYKTFNATHGMVMSFLKFAILSTMGEMIGLRISTGVYINRTFGIIPRMVVWGLLGMGINMVHYRLCAMMHAAFLSFVVGGDRHPHHDVLQERWSS